MNKEKSNKRTGKKIAYSAKECAYLAVFVALVIAAQLVLSVVPSVEIVTVLFCAYAFTFGVKRGMLAATAFSFLRQFVFGVYPTVLILYLVYFNLLATSFALLGKWIKKPLKWLAVIVVIACVCTVLFTMIDNVLTPLWYGYSRKATILYFKASLPFMVLQVINAALSVGVLFFPLYRAFSLIKRTLR